MATTAQTIINRAFRLIAVTDPGIAAPPRESEDALQSLNDLLADWALQPLLQYSMAQESYVVPASITSLTIGPTGAKATTRPDALSNLFLRVGSVDYDIALISGDEYKDISFKSVTGGYPSVAFYDPALSNGVLYLWPGAASGQTLFWDAVRPLQTFVAVTDTATLPPSYMRALAYNLAVEVASEYGVEPSSTVQRIAASSKRNLKRANTTVPHLSSDAVSISSSAGRLNITTNQ